MMLNRAGIICNGEPSQQSQQHPADLIQPNNPIRGCLEQAIALVKHPLTPAQAPVVSRLYTRTLHPTLHQPLNHVLAETALGF